MAQNECERHRRWALPLTAQRRCRSHSFWAMWLLLLVDASIFASLAFSHLHLSMQLEVCPPPGAALPQGQGIWLSPLLLLGGSLLVELGRLALSAERARMLRGALLLAMGCAGTALGLELMQQVQAGLAPRAQAWSASVAALLAWQWFHLALLLLVGAYLWLRSAAGLLRIQARASLDNSALLWHYVTVQGLAGLLLVRALAD
jgi:cytochrome c oxidase subunit I+III